MEMHFKYLGKLTEVDEKIERERHVSKTFRRIGGSKGGVRDAPPPASNFFFYFHAVFGKKFAK